MRYNIIISMNLSKGMRSKFLKYLVSLFGPLQEKGKNFNQEVLWVKE